MRRYHVTKVIILFAQGSIFDIQTSCQSTYYYAMFILNTRLLGVLFLVECKRDIFIDPGGSRYYNYIERWECNLQGGPQNKNELQTCPHALHKEP
jgi:hypothetical protein